MDPNAVCFFVELVVLLVTITDIRSDWHVSMIGTCVDVCQIRHNFSPLNYSSKVLSLSEYVAVAEKEEVVVVHLHLILVRLNCSCGIFKEGE